MSDADSQTIRAWTIQPWIVWERLETRGSLTVDPQFAGNLHECYEWLRGQLLQRIPGYSGHYPWWAYRTRPDLRRARHTRCRDQRFVLIEMELPREQVLEFPFWAWDCIFYGRFLSTNQRESADWERRLREAVPDEDTNPLPEPWLSELRSSWLRLFDSELPTQGWLSGSALPQSDREVVLEVLDRRFVRRVTPFLGARSPKNCEAL